jgi:CheY-like chemotaxis protein
MKERVLFRILLVEDSKMLVDRLRETLSDLGGVEVVGAVDGEAGAV